MHLYFLPQVQAIQEESARLQGAYAGNKAKEIKDQEQEVLDAWRNLHMKVESRRTTLANASDLYRFFNMVRDLLLWMDDIIRQTNTQEKPRYCLNEKIHFPEKIIANTTVTRKALVIFIFSPSSKSLPR